MDTDGLPSVSIPHADKYVHFVEYFVFFVVWFMYLYTTYKKSFLLTSFFAFLTVVFFGIIIEVLQGTLTDHRTFDWGDVLFNSLGALTSFVLLFVLALSLKRFK